MTTTTTFRRHPKYKYVGVTLTSNEELGVLDSGFLEDYYGADGFVTLRHVATMQDFTVKMDPLYDATPEIDHDVFQGFARLKYMPDGLYELRFRCRDVAGNYIISNGFQNPRGDEKLVHMNLRIMPYRGKPV